MEKKTQDQSQETPPVKKKKGGKQEGAGRPKGSKNLLSVHTLLDTIERKSGGQPYEELLVEDFLNARGRDLALTVKYHQLIVGRVMKTISEVEVTTPGDDVEAKQRAFDDALTKLLNIKRD